MTTDEQYMLRALEQAQMAADRDEVPVGVVVVCQDRIIARGHNLTETLNDVTAHAEMQAVTAAANALGGKVFERLHALRHRRTLRDVRRGFGVGASRAHCLRSCRPQTRLFCLRP